MSSIITSILSSTVGLLLNKARDMAAEKLKNGDVTDAQIRKIVVRELDDVKSRLDGLSRRDLLSSYSFLKEGVDFVNVALDRTKQNDEEKASLNEAQDDRSETSRMSSNVERDILNDALEMSCAATRVKTDSETQFKSAKQRFESARERATLAFCNEGLSIQDRIFAAKFRVVAEILECLHSPKIAITGCLSFLRQLHSLRAIREMFSVFLNDGRMFNREERLECVKSITLINYVLYQFVLKFSDKYYSLLDWPTIEVRDGGFNPILDWRKVSSSIAVDEILMKPPNVREITPSSRIHSSEPCAVNSRGEILIPGNGDIEIISRIKKTEVVKLPDSRENESNYIAALAVDENNNVYVLSLLRKRTESDGVNESYVLCVLDQNYDVKHSCTFDLEAFGYDDYVFVHVRIAVNKNNDIIMIGHLDPHVYVFDSCARLKRKFERDSRVVKSISISNNNEIMIPWGQHLQVYTEKGNLKSTIKVPERSEINHVAFSFVSSKIIILAFDFEKFSYFCYVYSETGQLESSIFVSNLKQPPLLTSHPNGPVAIIKRGNITYI